MKQLQWDSERQKVLDAVALILDAEKELNDEDDTSATVYLEVETHATNCVCACCMYVQSHSETQITVTFLRLATDKRLHSSRPKGNLSGTT